MLELIAIPTSIFFFVFALIMNYLYSDFPCNHFLIQIEVIKKLDELKGDLTEIKNKLDV